MKRILRLGGCYALIQKANKDFLCVQTLAQAPAHPGPGLAIGVLAFLLLISISSNASGHRLPAAPADTLSTEITPLQIGDTIPESLWHLPLQVVNHPEGKDTTTLNDYRGKLIILDFWATWCGSCIAAMPKANALVTLNSDSLAVIAVTQEAFDKVSRFWSTNEKTKPLKLPVVTDAHTLKTLFPHKMVPHLVWLSPEGEVSAFTSSAQLNQARLTPAFGNDFSAFRNKVDVDIHRPLFTTDNLPLASLQHLALLFRGRLEGTGSGSVLRRATGVVHGRMLSNKTLLALFDICGSELIEGYCRKRLIIESSHPEGLAPEFSALSPEHWKDSLLYTIEVIVPLEESHRLYTEMLATLNRAIPYTAGIETIEKECYVLKETNDGKKPAGYAGGKNPELVAALEKLPWDIGLVVDETAGRRPIGRDVLANVPDMHALQEVLQANGLLLATEQRKLDFLVIRDKTTY